MQRGRRTLGLAAEAKHELGVSYGKISRFFESAFGLTVCRAAWARAGQRLAQCAQPVCHKLLDVLRARRRACVDETGWKVGGQPAWLWVFTNEAVTVYVIDPTRAHQVVAWVLGEDFAGVGQCDCFLAYDPLTYDQQKCVRRLIRGSDELTESKSGAAVKFSRQVARLLRGSIQLKHCLTEGQISPAGFGVARGRLKAALNRLLAGGDTDPDNRKLARLLRKHREQLLVFLYEAGITPTNAEGEQAIRPAVAVRRAQDVGLQPELGGCRCSCGLDHRYPDVS